MSRSVLLLVLTAVLCHVQAPAASPAMQTGPLPSWETSASGPLRGIVTNGTDQSGGDLVIAFDHYTDDAYGYTLGPLTGTYRFTVPFTTDMGWTGYALEGQTPPANMGDLAAQNIVICDPNTGGNLVMLWGPDLHEHGKFDGLDTDTPTYMAFGNTTGTISVYRDSGGLPEIDLDDDHPLLPHARNWYAPWLLATNPPASSAPADAFAFDALVLPEGLYCTRRSASEFVVAERPMIEAMVQRYRTGLAPTNLPVNIDHASTNVVGRVTRLWHVAGSGLWVRLEVPKAACADRPFLSAEVRCLRATASDAWGSWGTFALPWTLRGVALTASPALSGTRYRLPGYVPSAAGSYPDPRTVNDTWTPRR